MKFHMINSDHTHWASFSNTEYKMWGLSLESFFPSARAVSAGTYSFWQFTLVGQQDKSHISQQIHTKEVAQTSGFVSREQNPEATSNC